jgi:1,4-alpha-glucan branching enzyme
LNFVIRKLVFDQDTIQLVSLSDYLENHPVHQKSTPATSSWGHKGYFQGWVNEKTDWIYPQLFECCGRMEKIAEKYNKETPTVLQKRALNQCAREVFLAQSSDWPFLINNGTSGEYATRRVKDHVASFSYLFEQLENGQIDEERLEAIETLDNIFPLVDYRVFR